MHALVLLLFGFVVVMPEMHMATGLDRPDHVLNAGDGIDAVVERVLRVGEVEGVLRNDLKKVLAFAEDCLNDRLETKFPVKPVIFIGFYFSGK